jgi:hypothetical protein
LRPVRLKWRESVSLRRLQNCNPLETDHFHHHAVEDELCIRNAHLQVAPSLGRGMAAGNPKRVERGEPIPLYPDLFSPVVNFSAFRAPALACRLFLNIGKKLRPVAARHVPAWRTAVSGNSRSPWSFFAGFLPRRTEKRAVVNTAAWIGFRSRWLSNRSPSE